MTKQHDTARRKKRRTKRWLAAGACLALVMGAAVWGIVWIVNWRWTGSQPIAPDAPKAEKWKGTPPTTVKNDSSPRLLFEGLFEEEPGPQIKFDDVPEVPQKLLGPSPPIEKTSGTMATPAGDNFGQT